MPASSNILLAGLMAILFWTGLGWPLARRLLPDFSLGLALSPVLGWAVFNAAALPILLILPFTRPVLAVLCGAALLGSMLLLRGKRAATPRTGGPSVPWWAYVLAAGLALAPAIALLPKLSGDGVLLADPMYDHSKVSMIDEIARLGVPAGNPYFGPAGEASRLAYYYLWHFGAAVFVRLLGVTGWEADIALTWATGFASLALMMGLAVWFSGRRLAAPAVILLCTALTTRPVLAWLLGDELFGRLISVDTNLEGWLSQASWVPQHLASANAVMLAIVLMVRLAEPQSRWLVPVLALVVAAGFESSIWIGGFTFAAAALPIGVWLLRSAEPARRGRLAASAGLAAILALILVVPFLRDEYLGAEARRLGVPIAFRPYEVLGPFFPDTLRRLLDLPAYWLLFLLIEFPAIAVTGAITLRRVLAAPETPPETRRRAGAFALLAASGFGICWLFASVIANNDLGWRAVLPGLMVLTIFAAAGLSRWLGRRNWTALSAALALFLLGLPDGLAFVTANASGIGNPDARILAASPALWDAVRRFAGPDERVGNNPLYAKRALTWPVNISWALFADRQSCFAGTDLALAYVALPRAEIDGLETLFERVFAGTGSADDIHLLAQRYDCRVIVVTPSDGAWVQDGFAASPDYRLVEEQAGQWRIYRVVGQKVR